MNTTDTAFKFPDRASYELGYLLRSLPDRLHENLTAEQQLEVEAADLHAMNSTGTLLRGLQGLGHIMWSAGVNEEQQVGAYHFASVGLMVSEIALQLQFLDEFRQSVAEHELREANSREAK